MAAMNFPENPVAGDEYPFGDFIYVYDGEKWNSKVIITSVDEYVKKTGDTMTGNLIIENNAPALVFSDYDNSKAVLLNATDGNFFIEDPTTPAYVLRYTQSTGVTGLFNAASETPQGTLPESLTRKDYVDGNFVPLVGAATKDGALRITNTAEDLCKIDISTYAATPRVDLYDPTGVLTGRFALEGDNLILWHADTGGKLSIGASGVYANTALHGGLTHTNGYMSIQPFGASYDSGGQAWIYYKDHDNGTPGVGMRGLVIETSNGTTGTGGPMDMTLNSQVVYHSGNHVLLADTFATNEVVSALLERITALEAQVAAMALTMNNTIPGGE